MSNDAMLELCRHMKRQRAALLARQQGEAGDSRLNSIDRTTSFGSFAPSLDRTTSIGSEGSASPRSSSFTVRRGPHQNLIPQYCADLPL